MPYVTTLLVLLQAALAAAAPRGVRISQLENWDIVIDEDAIPSEGYAAKEFQNFLKQTTDIHLPIVTSVAKGSNFHIYIGSGTSMKSSPVGFDVQDFGPEDLRIIVSKKNIAIAGGQPRGTLYGVYTFLEDYLGVRFLSHDHTYVPRAKKQAMISQVDRSYHPPMSYRFSAYKVNADHPEFAARLRCNTVTHDPMLGGTTDIMLFGHSFYRQIPWRKYSKSNPEYFGMRDGKYITEEKDAQLCLSHPEVLEIVTQAVLDELAANPDQKSIAVSQNDGGHKCRCPKCELTDQREESGMGTLLLFVNAVTKEVVKKYPDVKIGTLAYKYSQKPPKTIKAHPNVIVQLTTHDCSVTDPIETSTYSESVKFRQALEGWGRICDHINLWYYNTNFAIYQLPIPNMRVVEPNIRYFLDNGVKGIFMQAVYNAPQSGLSDLQNYMTSRLLWDPNEDGNKVMDEFLHLHYGKAGRQIRRFIDRLHESAEEKGIQYGWSGIGENFGIDASVVRVGVQALDEAFALTDDPTIRARLEKASIAIHAAAMSEALPWAWSGKDGKVPPDIAGRTRPHFREFFRLCQKYGITMWNEAVPMDEMYYFLKVDFGMKRDEPW